MKIIIKKGVDLKIRGKILYGLIVAIALASEMGASIFRISSGYRKKRGKLNSFHPVRLATDYVVVGISILAYKRRLKQKLGKNYDLVYHNTGSGPHFHLEFDEK